MHITSRPICRSPRQPDVQLVLIHGGLPGAELTVARTGDVSWLRAAEETLAEFTDRVRDEAEAIGEPFAVIGGLPD